MRFERRGSGSRGSGSFGGRRFGGGGGRGGFGRDRRDFNDDEPKPVNVGETYDVEVTETGSRGDGIARVKNFVVFIDGVKQGEKAKIEITDVRNRFALGKKVGDASVEATAESGDKVAEATEADVKKAEETEAAEPAAEEPAEAAAEPVTEEKKE